MLQFGRALRLITTRAARLARSSRIFSPLPVALAVACAVLFVPM